MSTTHDAESAAPCCPGRADCPSCTAVMPTGDLLCPRWCITYKLGKSDKRHGCFGRTWFDEIQPTVRPSPCLASGALHPKHLSLYLGMETHPVDQPGDLGACAAITPGVHAQVVGRAEPHNLALIHPEQCRVLSIRENARCQARCYACCQPFEKGS